MWKMAFTLLTIGRIYSLKKLASLCGNLPTGCVRWGQIWFKIASAFNFEEEY